MPIPTRTSNDPNASADINSLQTQITSLTATVASATAAIYATLTNYGQNTLLNGTLTTIYFKTFTGTTAGSPGDTDVGAHGVNQNKVIHASAGVKYNGADFYFVEPNLQFRVGTTHLYTYHAVSGYNSMPYFFTIGYYL